MSAADITADVTRIALDAATEFFAEREPEVVVTEGDLVAMIGHEVRALPDGAPYDFFAFLVSRVANGQVVESWNNLAEGTAPFGSGTPAPERPTALVGSGDPEANKPRVIDFFRCIFDAHNPAAVADYYARGFVQHSRTQPQTVEEVEGLVRFLFPDGPIPTPDTPDLPVSVIVAEGDLVVIASQLPQPSASGGVYQRNLFDGFRVRDGLMVEHWGGQDAANMPRPMGPGAAGVTTP